MNNKIGFFCGLTSMAISIITITLFFIKVNESSVVDVSTFLGVIAAFIGISVTLLIGYQIFNVLDFRNKLAKVEELRKSLEEQHKDMKTINLQQQEGFNIILARLYDKDCLQTLNAVLALMSAIPYSLSLTQKAEGYYSSLLNELKNYMLKVIMPSFGGGTPEQIKSAVDNFRAIFNPIDQSIRNHENFFFIRERYVPLMKSFNIRLDNIASFKNVGLIDMEEAIPFKDYKYDD